MCDGEGDSLCGRICVVLRWWYAEGCLKFEILDSDALSLDESHHDPDADFSQSEDLECWVETLKSEDIKLEEHAKQEGVESGFVDVLAAVRVRYPFRGKPYIQYRRTRLIAISEFRAAVVR